MAREAPLKRLPDYSRSRSRWTKMILLSTKRMSFSFLAAKPNCCWFLFLVCRLIILSSRRICLWQNRMLQSVWRISNVLYKSRRKKSLYCPQSEYCDEKMWMLLFIFRDLRGALSLSCFCLFIRWETDSLPLNNLNVSSNLYHFRQRVNLLYTWVLSVRLRGETFLESFFFPKLSLTFHEVSLMISFNCETFFSFI